MARVLRFIFIPGYMLFSSLLLGQEPAIPESQPATATTTSATPAEIDPKVESILDRLEQRGEQIINIETDILFRKTDSILESTERYAGVLRYLKDEPNPRFFICFDRFIQDGRESRQRRWHIFDGRWYIEANERLKTITKREIARPDERCDAFKVGEGPFPLPFGQKKADILRVFTVEIVPTEDDKDKNLDHLKCTPRPNTEMDRKYAAVHFYVDRDLNLPVRMQTVDKEEHSEIEVIFPVTSIRINTGLPASKLNLPMNELRDYEITTEPLPDSAG
ncbi:MAG: hypothetical protein GXY44_03045 [Phycisphaerales bacterium]|nr:hypothetical protein [Phycisphaerales bacterium]